MKPEKSNIEFLRDILKEMGYIDSEKCNEAIELLDSIQQELKDKDVEISDYERRAEEDDDSDEEEVEYDNSDFVGLDTINWSLDNGNMAIQQKMESFIERLKRENAVVPA